jgi:hypothetical protein
VKAFFTRYPTEAAKETRTIMVPDGEPVPADSYGFLEFFCKEVECDCRRVLIRVVSRNTERVMATLTYGWETVEFYRKWSHGDHRAQEMAGVSIDPLATQTEYASYFLAVFCEMISVDSEYRSRLQRHYEMFKRPDSGAKHLSGPRLSRGRRSVGRPRSRR